MRDDRGRFTKGNPGGPGRKPLRVERDYLGAIVSVVDADEWEAVVRRALDDAKAGDPRAREWVSRYLIRDGDLAAPAAAPLGTTLPPWHEADGDHESNPIDADVAAMDATVPFAPIAKGA